MIRLPTILICKLFLRIYEKIKFLIIILFEFKIQVRAGVHPNVLVLRTGLLWHDQIGQLHRGNGAGRSLGRGRTIRTAAAKGPGKGQVKIKGRILKTMKIFRRHAAMKAAEAESAQTASQTVSTISPSYVLNSIPTTTTSHLGWSFRGFLENLNFRKRSFFLQKDWIFSLCQSNSSFVCSWSRGGQNCHREIRDKEFGEIFLQLIVVPNFLEFY